MSTDAVDASTLSSEGNQSQFDAEHKSLCLTMEELYGQLARIEYQLDRIGFLLRVSQPPMFEKLDVRWWLRSGSAVGRKPHLIRWVKAKRSNRYKAVVVQRLRLVRSDGGFAINHKQTEELAKLAQSLIAEREGIRDTIIRIKRAMSGINGRLAIIDHAGHRIKSLHWTIADNLVKAGYNVEEHLLPDGYLEDAEQ